jgi:hypothetical protein
MERPRREQSHTIRHNMGDDDVDDEERRNETRAEPKKETDSNPVIREFDWRA